MQKRDNYAMLLLKILIALILLYGILTLLFYEIQMTFNPMGIIIIGIVIAILEILLYEEGPFREFSFKNKKITYFLVATVFFLALILRAIPYINNSIPLGYDPGIYKHYFELFREAIPKLPELSGYWFGVLFRSGIGLIADLFYLAGFDFNSIIILTSIFFSAFVVLQMFILTRKKHSTGAAIFASFFCAVSFAQLNMFFLMYYKNIIAIILLLSLFFVVYDLKTKKNLIAAILLNSAIGFIHKPTFLLSSVLLIVYAIINFKDKEIRNNSMITIAISTIAILPFYFPVVVDLINSLLVPALEKHTSGTFVTTDEYLSLALPLIPFALFGIITELIDVKERKIKKKAIDLLAIFFLLSAFIVFSKLIFFRRFIVFLDLGMVCFAGIGFAKITKMIYNYKKEFLVVLLPVIAAALILAITASTTAKPLINETQLEAIKAINDFTEENATIISATNYSAPWLLGYVDRNIISPGLFENNAWDFNTWKKFWFAKTDKEIIEMMHRYNRPLYVFILKDETSSYINMDKFEQGCFEKIFNMEGGILYKFLC